MANRNFFAPIQSSWHKPILVGGQVALSAAAAVSSSTIKGATIAKTGTGVYTLTLDDSYPALISASVQVGGTSAAIFGDLGTVDVSGARTIQILTVNATGAPTDVAATCVLYITVILNNSSVD